MAKELFWISVSYIAGSFILALIAYGSLVYVLTTRQPDREQILSFANSLTFPFSIFRDMLKQVVDGTFVKRQDFNWQSALLTKLIASIPYLLLMSAFWTRVLEEAGRGNTPMMLLYLFATVIYGFSFLCAWFFGRRLGNGRKRSIEWK